MFIFSNIRSSFQKKIYLNKKRIDAVLAMMFFKEKQISKFRTLLCDIKEQNNLKVIYEFLSNYTGDEIITDFVNLFNKLDMASFSIEFYIYFLKMYICRYNDDTYEIKNNIDYLFYELEVEAIFNQDKFRSHFKKHYLSGMNLDYEIDYGLVQDIKSEIPSNIESELELALYIYILLCKKVKYDSKYVIFRNYDDILNYNHVTSENNDVICVTFAIIYYKLLKDYGLDVNLSGDFFTHMKVELRIKSMMLEADGTMFGFDTGYSSEYRISDIGNVKFGLSLRGFNLAEKYYTDLEYIKYNQKRLDSAVLRVSKFLNINGNNVVDISNILYNGFIEIRKIRKKNNKLSKEEIDYRISLLNSLFRFKNEDCECENKQLLSKFKYKIFGDLRNNGLRDVLLYSFDDNKIKLYYLYIIYLEDQTLCYLEDDDGFVFVEPDSLVNQISSRRLEYKNEKDISIINGCVLNSKNMTKK